MTTLERIFEHFTRNRKMEIKKEDYTCYSTKRRDGCNLYAAAAGISGDVGSKFRAFFPKER